MSAGLRSEFMEELQLEGCLMLPSCRQGEEGGECRRVSLQTKEPAWCVYIGLSQPAVSDFRPLLYRENFPWFSVNTGAGRELTLESSWKTGEFLDFQALLVSFSRELHLPLLAIFSDLEYCFIPSQSAICVFQLGPDFQHGR